MKKKDSFASYIKAMAHINGQVVMPEVKLYKPRKPRAKETKPRKREEDAFRNLLIKFLRKHGCKVIRIEPSFRGEFGLGDLWVFCERTAWGGWVETKSLTGRLSDDQKEVKRLSEICNVKYLVAKKFEDTDEIILKKI